MRQLVDMVSRWPVGVCAQRELLASGSNRDETVLVWDLTRLSEGRSAPSLPFL